MKLKVKSILTVLMYLYFVSVSVFNFSVIYLSSAIIFCIVALGINIYLKKIKWSYFFSFQLIFCLYEIIMIYLGKSVSSSLSKSATMTVLFNMIISLAMFSVFESKSDVKEFFKKVSILSVAILIFIIVYIFSAFCQLFDLFHFSTSIESYYITCWSISHNFIYFFIYIFFNFFSHIAHCS